MWREVTSPMAKTRSGATRMCALRSQGSSGWFTAAHGSGLSTMYFTQ